MNYSQKEKTGRERERKGKIRVVLLMANGVFRKPWFLCSIQHGRIQAEHVCVNGVY
jgi:hypothetical protein